MILLLAVVVLFVCCVAFMMSVRGHDDSGAESGTYTAYSGQYAASDTKTRHLPPIGRDD